jgi:prepilin-type N-terminal cleavage/methylation domain-containing protein
MRSAFPRRAFTLVELLVVIAIIGVLVSMVVPAVQSARESARRTSCSNNIRELAQSVLQYENANSAFPAAAKVYKQNPSYTDGRYDPWREASAESPHVEEKGTSWILEVLPFMEESALANAWDRGTNVLGNAALAQQNIAMLYCPSRRAGIRADRGDQLNLVRSSWTGGGTDYGGCYGRVDGFENDDSSTNHRFTAMSDGTTTPASGGVEHKSGLLDGVFRAADQRPAALVRDGLSKSILLGELQRLRPLAGATGVDASIRRSFDGWAVGGVATLFVTATDPEDGRLNPGGMNNYFFESPGSDHVGGAFFAMADGSVHFVSEFVDAKDNASVFPLLGSIRDGSATSPDVAGY